MSKGFTLKEFKDLRDSVVVLAKENNSFLQGLKNHDIELSSDKDKVLLDKLILPDVNGRYIEEVYLSRVLLYHWGIVYPLSSSNIVLEDDKASFQVFNSVNYNFDLFSPNMIKNKFNWSKPHASDKYCNLIKGAYNVIKEDEYMNFLVHAHMVNGVFTHTIAFTDGSIVHLTESNGDLYEDFNRVSASLKIMSFVEKFGKPVKELYFVYSDNPKGEFIYRKNEDGEYTITMY